MMGVSTTVLTPLLLLLLLLLSISSCLSDDSTLKGDLYFDYKMNDLLTDSFVGDVKGNPPQEAVREMYWLPRSNSVMGMETFNKQMQGHCHDDIEQTHVTALATRNTFFFCDGTVPN